MKTKTIKTYRVAVACGLNQVVENFRVLGFNAKSAEFDAKLQAQQTYPFASDFTVIEVDEEAK